MSNNYFIALYLTIECKRSKNFRHNEEEKILDERDAVLLRIPGDRALRGPPTVEILAPIDHGMWLNMVNVKPPHLADLEVKFVKKIILDYKRYGQKCPRQLLRNMQQFILEEQLEVICDEVGIEYEKVGI